MQHAKLLIGSSAPEVESTFGGGYQAKPSNLRTSIMLPLSAHLDHHHSLQSKLSSLAVPLVLVPPKLFRDR